MARFVLDPSGTESLENEYQLAEDDVSLLQGVLDQRSIFVRGERLCRWASQIADARGYEQIWRKAPVQELLEDCSGISFSEAKNILFRIGELLGSLPRPIKSADVVKLLWPNDALWGEAPSNQHAFDWLLWCSSRSLPSEDVTLLSVIKERWLADITSDALCQAYKVIHTKDAFELLKSWLGLNKSNIEWPSLPAELPKVLLDRLKAEWRSQLVRTDGQYFKTLEELGPPREVLVPAARVTLEYYETNPSSLTTICADTLSPYLTFQEFDKLYSLLPPDDPGFPPVNFKDVIQWFKTRYIPYRLKSSKGNADRVREIARYFALWFLGFYAQSRAGGDGAEYLSWCKTARLENSSDSITLLVVLDGLGFRDGEYFAKLIQEKSRRLSMDEFDIVVSPLPTVTCMAKPALFTGFKPSYALEEESVGTVERRAPEVIRAINDAIVGDIVIWSILEPDHTYHQSKDSESIKSEVNGWLQGFAARLVDVINQVNDSIKLRMIITTDHGRLLSGTQRLQQVPQGMVAHGRAAWGVADIEFEEKGYVINNDVVYLHPERFGTPQVCALLLNDESFVMSDGRSGTESFPHGGIFPEEVLIPWIQFSRDRGTIIIEASLTGKGVAKSSGTYFLEIMNTSPVRINVLEIEILQIGYKTPLRFEVAAMDKKLIDIPVTYWPTTSECISLDACIVYALPTGERKTLVIKPSLEIEEMYQQEDILSDL